MKDKISNILVSVALVLGLSAVNEAGAKEVKRTTPITAKGKVKPAIAPKKAKKASVAVPAPKPKSKGAGPSQKFQDKPDRKQAKPAAPKPKVAPKAKAAPKVAVAPKCPQEDLKRRQHVKFLTNMATGEILVGADDADKRFFEASVTKVMPIYATLRLSREGKLDLDKPIPVPRVTFKNARGDVDMHDVIPSNVVRATPRMLMYAARISSSNRAAHALALAVGGGTEAGFARLANQYVSEWGVQANYVNGSGYPTAVAVKAQWTTARATTAVINALEKEFPNDVAALNVPRKELVGFAANSDTPRKFKIKTRIEAQDSGYEHYTPSLGLIKTGYACPTGLASAGIVKVSGINVSFMMAGYPNYQTRDKELNDEIARIEKRIDAGEIQIAKPEIRNDVVETVIPLNKESLASVTVANPVPVNETMRLTLLLAAAGGIGFGLGRGKRRKEEASGDLWNHKGELRMARGLNPY